MVTRPMNCVSWIRYLKIVFLCIHYTYQWRGSPVHTTAQICAQYCTDLCIPLHSPVNTTAQPHGIQCTACQRTASTIMRYQSTAKCYNNKLRAQCLIFNYQSILYTIIFTRKIHIIYCMILQINNLCYDQTYVCPYIKLSFLYKLLNHFCESFSLG